MPVRFFIYDTAPTEGKNHFEGSVIGNEVKKRKQGHPYCYI